MGWAAAEFQTIDLGDARLNQRAVTIAEALGLAPGRTIPQACQSWASTKACYNFFSNGLVSENKIVAPHIKQTIDRMKECPIVLLPNDTSELDYNSKDAMEGKERITNTKTGLWLHPTIAITPERVMLGIIDVNFWKRESEINPKGDKAPIEEKESYRWLQSYKRSCEIARQMPGTQIINIADREGDIIELFDEVMKEKEFGCAADIIVRAQHDRLLVKEKRGEKSKLRQKLKAAPTLGEIEFAIPSTEKRSGRKVRQQLKALSVKMKPRHKNVSVKINVVMAIEENPPQGEEALMWILITSLPIETFDEVVRVINYYLCRWEIETFFKVLKSGCKIEERQLQTTDRMKALITMFMILAWRVMYTMMMGRVHGEMPCDVIFNEVEWRSVYKILHRKKELPKKAPSLGEFIKMVATFGGYVDRKSEGPPGVKVVWKGMARMLDFALAWEAFTA
jgi:transposase-like protein/transposase Tn5 family protein